MCKYCHSQNRGDFGKELFSSSCSLFGYKIEYSAVIDTLTGDIWIHPSEHDTDESILVKINYCPMCGRKLQKAR